jgi:HEPN domain-containing protein
VLTMASRAEDWFRQALRDLEHARDTLERGIHEWVSFAAQQSAEKAVKGVYQRLGAEARGHSVTQLLSALPAGAQPRPELIELAKELDKHYIAPRYPSSYPEGAPMDFYTRAEAVRAIEAAEQILDHGKRHIFR